jgi:Family of unknown function (DUF6082)
MPIKRLRLPSGRFVVIIAITASLLAIIGLVILSPFALNELTHSGRNWSQLSNIGQTYGAVSALLSSLALVGVVISLLYQARDSRVAHEEATRTLQHELLKIELEDPVLMTAGGAPWGLPISSDFTSIRQFLFVQMWISFLAGNYAIGESSEAGVRHIAANELFRSKAGRSYWEAVGQSQLDISRGRSKHFFQILDEEYKKVLSGKVPLADPIRTSDPSEGSITSSNVRNKEQALRLGLIVAAATTGVLAERFWHRINV